MYEYHDHVWFNCSWDFWNCLELEGDQIKTWCTDFPANLDSEESTRKQLVPGELAHDQAGGDFGEGIQILLA